MLNWVKGKIALAVVRASQRGNRVAQRLIATETRKAYDALPEQSPIVRGDFMTMDETRPLPEDQQGGMLGDYELMPLQTRPVAEDALVGKRVLDGFTNLGSYGMGGYGFFGLCFGEGDWLIVPIIGAEEWMVLDGQSLAQHSGLSERLSGASVAQAEIAQHALEIRFDNGAVLAIDADAATRARFPGTGKARAFLEGDDLRVDLFMSPTGYIEI